MYTAERIASLFPKGNHLLPFPESRIEHVCIDSRKAAWQPNAIFLALQGSRIDGHRYIQDAWDHGVRNFLIRTDAETGPLPEGNYIRVPDVLAAFHTLAAFHRSQYTGTVIAIIGSNGKTWVKEWLYTLLYRELSVYRSPGSYNSQVGVPLSVWNISLDSRYAIIEAGISAPGEMEPLQKIILPDIVLFTHLGDAHDEGFRDDHAWKLREKLKMCAGASTLVFPEDEVMVRDAMYKQFSSRNLVSWSLEGHGMLQASATREQGQTAVHMKMGGFSWTYRIPYAGMVPVANSVSCFAALIALGFSPDPFLSWFEELQPIDMRLKAEEGIQGCVLINDSYSLDLDSLQYALESLDIAGPSQKKTLVLSDHAFGRERIYQHLAKMISGAGVDKLICVGEEVSALVDLLPPGMDCRVYTDVDDLIRKGAVADFYNEVILLKGARKFGFERIARQLRLRSHSAVLHVDFGALDHNLRYFYRKIRPGVRKIAVVKANAYGAGSLEVCRFLSYQHVDMLAVALIDEGIELRESGISLPVIVLNPDPEGMDLILRHHLEPEIYNLHIFQRLLDQCRYSQEPAVIHLKLDSGTHRLGFGPGEIDALIQMLRDQHWITVGTVFTHLSGSDDARWDDFTHEQVRRFDAMYSSLTTGIGYAPPRHVLSTSGILRFPQYQYESVRLGIGLYGVGVEDHPQLIPVHSLRARILHLQEIQAGESVSYSRSFMAGRPHRIATVNIGYADGLPRIAGNAGCTFVVNGMKAPITGRVCMDMTMIDVTEIPDVSIGDEVIIFDQEHSIEFLAKACHTIPYEIMTHLHPRIRKVYEHG